MYRNHSYLLLVSMGLLVLPSLGQAQQLWQLEGGQVALALPTNPKEMLGLRVEGVRSTAPSVQDLDLNYGFAIKPSRDLIQFSSQNYLFDLFKQGSLGVSGGFSLALGNQRVEFREFSLRPTGESPRSLIVIEGADSRSGKKFDLHLSGALVRFMPESNRLELAAGDLRLSPRLAAHLGNPELANFVVGSYSVHGPIRQLSGPALPPPQEDPPFNLRATYDVGICNLSGLTSQGRVGTFPNGQVAVAASTTSTNFASTFVPWFAASTTIWNQMDWRHPVIAQNVFRIEGGKFEQLAEGWVKHGFTATNTTECYPGGWANLPGIPAGTGCVSGSGGGTNLRTGCHDTYGSGLNSSRQYLGPKTEVNPRTGVWNPVGSWFSMGVQDNIRRRNGSQRVNLQTNQVENWTPTVLENRMVVDEVDLDRPVGTAQFFYEAYYVSQSEINTYNQIMWRQTTVTKGTSSFSFGATNTHGIGPAINMWPGATKQTMAPQADGDVIVAVKTTELTDGWYFYDYAVYVHDLDRQVDGFFVSVDDSVPVRNITYRDIDKVAANDWNVSRSNGNVRWSMKAAPNDNSLFWGRVFNFRFEAQTPPVSSFAQADMVKPGAFPWLTTALSGPSPSARPVSGTLTIPGRGTEVGTTVDLRLTPVGGGTPTIVPGVSVDMATGAFTAQTTLRGQFQVAVQGAPFLRRAFSPVVNLGPDGAGQAINLTLIPGDVNGSNEIDAADIDMAISQFGATGSNVADVDASGEVDAADIDLVISNFGQIGDN